MDAYQCQANIDHGEIHFKKNQLISAEAYNDLPDKIKFKFQKLSQKPEALNDAAVRKILLELVNRVEAIESKLNEKSEKVESIPADQNKKEKGKV